MAAVNNLAPSVSYLAVHAYRDDDASNRNFPTNPFRQWQPASAHLLLPPGSCEGDNES